MFNGVHLECEKKPIHIIHFIGYLSAKYLPPFFPINPIPHKIMRLFFYSTAALGREFSGSNDIVLIFPLY
jgi:hypothetical protein